MGLRTGLKERYALTDPDTDAVAQQFVAGVTGTAPSPHCDPTFNDPRSTPFLKGTS